MRQQNLTHDTATLKQVEAFVQLLETDERALQFVHRKPATQVHVDIFRNIHLRHAIAHEGAAQHAVFTHPGKVVDAEHGGAAADAHTDHFSAAHGDGLREFECLRTAGDLERMVDTAVGEVHHLLHGVRVTCVDAVRSAHGKRQTELAWQHVDADDL